VGFFVKTGTRDEAKPVMGVSHFLEHMMFKGTDRRTAEEVNREFDQIGADYNAYTNHETTVYYAQVLPEYLARAVDLLGDMLRPALRESDFTTEKKVILEEIGMYDDRPHWRLHDVLLESYFQGGPMGYRVLGTVESIQALSVSQMRGYFEERYGSDNMVVSAAGRVDFDALVGDLERLTAEWKPCSASKREGVAGATEEQLTVSDGRVNRHYLAVMSPAPSAQDMRRYAAKVMSDVIGADEGSRLYWSLVDPGLADEADFSFMPQDQTGSFVAYASCDPERSEQVEAILLRTVDRFVERIDPAEVERAKNKIATLATLHGERPGGRMRSLGGQWTYLGEYLPLEVELERIMAVSEGDIKRLMSEVPFAPRTIVRLGPPR
jgi:predicted Zn-dependent peptidase